MHTLYEVIPGPRGPLGAQGCTAVPWAWTPPPGEGQRVERYYESGSEAYGAAKTLCARVSAANPGPGLRSGQPVDVIVVEHRFSCLADVARRKPSKSKRAAIVKGTTWSKNAYADMEAE